MEVEEDQIVDLDGSPVVMDVAVEDVVVEKKELATRMSRATAVGRRKHIKPNCPKKDEKCRKCGKVGHLQLMYKAARERAGGNGGGGDGHKKQPEVAQFDSFESFACEVTIGEELLEGTIVEVDLAGNAHKKDDKWLGDAESSHHMKATREGMVNVEPCPPGTRIRQVQGFANVKEWGIFFLEVDGKHGKHIMQLRETLIVPDINVNLFSQ